MKKILTPILVLLSFTIVINAGFITVSAADNSQYQFVKDQSFYCAEFQGFYNITVNSSKPLIVDGYIGPATLNAYNHYGTLIK